MRSSYMRRTHPYRTEKKMEKRREYREIREDHREVANLPQEVIQYSVGEEMRDLPYYYDDSMRGLDDQAREDYDKVSRSMDRRY